jgi:thymidylate synthase ThyX
VAVNFQNRLREDADEAFRHYHDYLGRRRPDEQGAFPDGYYAEVQENGGISRELARINLPLSTYTQWYWKIDLHNLLHFLFLRLDEHAQWEIRQYAEVMAKMVEAVCPAAWEAFCDYRKEAVRLSLPEQEVLRGLAEQFLRVLDEQFHSGVSPSLPDATEGDKTRLNTRLNQREVGELRRKLVALGLGFLVG